MNDVKREEMATICDKCFEGAHHDCTRTNLLNKACLCICRD